MARVNTPIRIMGLFKKDMGETAAVSVCFYVRVNRGLHRRTSGALLVILLGCPGLDFDYQPIPSLSPVLSFVIPLVANEGLPRLNFLPLITTTLHRLFDSNIYAQLFECVVAAIYGGEIAPNGYIVEVERIRASDIGF